MTTTTDGAQSADPKVALPRDEHLWRTGNW